jgi:hypothetical protein
MSGGIPLKFDHKNLIPLPEGHELFPESLVKLSVCQKLTMDMVCEICEKNDKQLRAVFYPGSQSLCIYCEQCLSQPCNMKVWTECRVFEIGTELKRNINSSH